MATKNAPKSTPTSKPQEKKAVEEKKEKVAPIVEAKIEDIDNSEKEALEKELEEMRKQMAFLMGQMSAQEKESSKPVKERNIPFVNLTPGTFNLRGSQLWKLVGQFAQRTFTEREARIILNNMQNAIRTGMVYIADAQFVEENDLLEAYRFLLSDADLRDLLTNNSDYVIEIYKSASVPQQKIITEMIEAKKLNGEIVDGNVLVEIGKLSGKDLVNIESE